MPERTLYTIGHGQRTMADLLSALASFGVACLVDVRMYPGSRRNPQFGQESLRAALSDSGIAYVHERSLGGRRRGLGSVSPNTAWENASFRAYADFMMEDSFWRAIEELLTRVDAGPTAVLCAETVWWRCHRRLIADAAVAQGASVVHIMAASSSRPHRLSPPAHIAGNRVAYCDPPT